ncbi:ATP-binding protein [Geodermatophilus ruber]|uniref:histidine kinase n=1 Tax=Geodermatophilus ruber TaxID=504800 RepID=A0A1I4ILE8_9ACTN|nr:ATP-binding protein [Geodermatophilus ruber]SFL55140.1 response regulator receiver and ANTAR domain protein [Geodermatophilus ruber]
MSTSSPEPRETGPAAVTGVPCDRPAPRVGELFPGDGPVSRHLRSVDWTTNPLGPPAAWPEELVAAVRTVFSSRRPVIIMWGPEALQLYNDPVVELLGDKHPEALTRPAEETFPEAWSVFGPLIEQVWSGRGASLSEEQLVPLVRHGYVEETYWTYSYSPILSATDQVCGTLVITGDVTATVLAHRRLQTLRDLGALSTAKDDGPASAVRAVLGILSAQRRDVPFAAAYLRTGHDDGGGDAIECGGLELVASYGYRPATGPADQGPPPGRLPALREVVESGRAAVLEDLTSVVGGSFDAAVPLGNEPPRSAVLLPISLSGSTEPAGVLALAVSPYRELDADYRIFLDLVTARASIAVTDAMAYVAERRRAEALADLDAAKTRFLQNVSHEFRTPLTLVLGPLGELLHDPGIDLPAARREGLHVAQRATRRLARLVDGLLDVARAEADRLHAVLEPTPLGELSTDVASMFRSVTEQAGLELVVDVEPAVDAEPVLVDREMWARIVLNLLSNAVKFTEHGRITVTLRSTHDMVELAVSDTGTGISPEEAARVFDRFHQAPGPGGGSREGAGLGLSLVRDSARAHGGSAGVTSTPGLGSTFTVTLPRRTADGREVRSVTPPAELVATHTAEAPPWVARPAASTPAAERAGTVVLVEDDADMRRYVTRLLEGDGWRVESAPDVETALARIREPDLVLSDLMLPGRDGLELLRLLRGTPGTATIPVVLLTARADSHSTASGLAGGADDYVVKPFEPAELLARVRAHVELARLRGAGRAEADEKAANLRLALESNRRIGTALGILMDQRKISSEGAFDLLREASNRLNRKLRDIAEDVVWTGTLPL